MTVETYFNPKDYRNMMYVYRAHTLFPVLTMPDNKPSFNRPSLKKLEIIPQIDFRIPGRDSCACEIFWV